MLSIFPIPAFNDNYIWVICNTKENTAICVDPGDAKPVIQWLSKTPYQLKQILITHHHADHQNGLMELKHLFPKIEILSPEDTRIPLATLAVRPNQIIDLSSCSFQILNTPGHTSTHICYYEPNQQWLFCGDTLFSAGSGRVFDGTIEQLYETFNQLKCLPGQTQIYCGHEYTLNNLLFAHHVEPDNKDIQKLIFEINQKPNECTLPSTIDREKKINPFMRLPLLTEFAKKHNIPIDDTFSLFKKLREEKNHANL